jgi:hypothetical protein
VFAFSAAIRSITRSPRTVPEFSLLVLLISTFYSVFHKSNSPSKDMLRMKDEPQCFVRKHSGKRAQGNVSHTQAAAACENLASIQDDNRFLCYESIQSLLVMKETQSSRL